MRWMIVLMMLAALCVRGANADALDPLDFVSGGPFPTGSVTIDTDDLTVGGTPWPNASVVEQFGADLAVFTFDGDASGTGSILFIGARAAVVLFQGPASIAGSWLASAASGTGRGPGASSTAGGGGGGFGGPGGFGSGAPGGTSYGDLFTLLEAGSNGGNSGGQGAGLGGGAIEIGAIGELDVSGLAIIANGSGGATIDSNGTGGGSGGGVLLHGYDVRMSAATQISANGGRGGDGEDQPFGYQEGGGGGGGGRIAVLRNTAGSFTQGGAQFGVFPGQAGDAGPTFPSQAGVQGSVSIDYAPAIGVPEPSVTGLGIAALLALWWRARNR